MFNFDENSVVCFLGDSITNRSHWMRRVYDYYRNKKGIKCEMYNCGIGGDTAWGGHRRLEDTVYTYNPTDVVICFGMNDVGTYLYTSDEVDDNCVLERRRRIDNCVTYLYWIAASCERHNVRVTLCTPTMYDELSENNTPVCEGVNAALKEIAKRAKELARRRGYGFVDFHTPFCESGKELFKIGKTLINEDRVHPDIEGNELMAQIFLKSQGFDVEVTGDFDKLKEASKKPFSEWEEKRYELQLKAKCADMAEWVLFDEARGEDALVKACKKFIEESKDEKCIASCKAYLTERQNIPEYRKALIEYTKQK